MCRTRLAAVDFQVTIFSAFTGNKIAESLWAFQLATDLPFGTSNTFGLQDCLWWGRALLGGRQMPRFR
eukprot:symbB.v1.2.007316.t1/scaffold447.1/size204395/13